MNRSLLVILLVTWSVLIMSSEHSSIQVQPDGSTIESPSSSSTTPPPPSTPPPHDDEEEEERLPSIIHTTVDPNPTVDFRSELPVFVPTHEWQEVLPGQHVPGGLHYRLDLEQGKKWAKYLSGIDGEMSIERQKEQDAKDSLKQIRIVDNVDSDRNRGATTTGTGAPTTTSATTNAPTTSATIDADADATRADARKKEFQGLKYKKLTKEQQELQRAELMDRVLMGLPAPPPELIGLDKKIDPEKWKEVLNLLWIKRQKMILDASSKIHNSATAMQNATRDLMDVTTTVSEKIQILTAMEQEVRQIDNAQDFKTVGGFAVTASLLEDPSMQVQLLSAFVMASASRNHEVVQAAALELGVVDQLLKQLPRLAFHSQMDSSEFDLRLRTTSKFIHALGAVVRGAQQNIQHLSRIGGSTAVEQVLESCHRALQLEKDRKTIRQLCTLRDKIHTLTTDLLEGPYEWTLINQLTVNNIQSSATGGNFIANIYLLSGSTGKCNANPNREVFLKLLSAMQDKQLLSPTTMVEYGIPDQLTLWIEEWQKEIQLDPNDSEYAHDLMAIAQTLEKGINA